MQERLKLYLGLASNLCAFIGGCVLLGLGAWGIRFPNLFVYGGDAVQFARRAEAGLLGIGIGIVLLGVCGLVLILCKLCAQERLIRVTGLMLSGGVFTLFFFAMALAWAGYARRDKPFEAQEYRNAWIRASREERSLVCAIESAYGCRGFEAPSECVPTDEVGCPLPLTSCTTPTTAGVRDLTRPGDRNLNETTPTPAPSPNSASEPADAGTGAGAGDTTSSNVGGKKVCFEAIVAQMGTVFLPAALISTLGVLAVSAQFLGPCFEAVQ